MPNLNTVRRKPPVSVEIEEKRYVEMKTKNMKIKNFLRNCEVEKKENYNNTIEELQRRNQ